MFFIFAIILIVVIGVSIWIAREPVRGIYLAILGAGFLLSPQLPLVRQKLSIVEPIIFITWSAMLIWYISGNLFSKGKLQTSQKRAIYWAGGLVGITLISYIFNTLIANFNIIGSTVQLLSYCYNFLIFFTVILLVDDWQKLEKCLLAWLGGITVAGIVGAWATLGSAPAWAYDPVTMRVSSTLLKSNQLPSYMAPMLVFLLFISSLRSSRVWLRIGGALLIVFIIISFFGTGSRTAFGLLLIAFGMIFLLGFSNRNSAAYNEKLLYVFGGLIIAGVLIYVFNIWTSGMQYKLSNGSPAAARAVLQFRDAANGSSPLMTTRAVEFQMVWAQFMHYPVIGLGPSNFTSFFQTNEVHNTYLATLIEEGIPGFILLLGWLGAILHIGWTSRRTFDPQKANVVICLCCGFVLLLLYGMTMFGLDQRHFWMMAGLLCALPRISGNERYRISGLTQNNFISDKHTPAPLSSRGE
jgi:O-antigen ligase